MSFNPMHNTTAATNIYLFAIIRSTDKCIIASYVRSKEVTVEGVRECIASNVNILRGKRYTSQGAEYAIHYIQDAQGRVFSIVTAPKYSPRIAFAALDDLQGMFNKELGLKAATAAEGSLSRPASNIFKFAYEKYENPANVDKLTAVQEKVDVIKTTMKENISQLLINEEKMKNIELASAHLNDQAITFGKSSKALRDKMWWKMWKMRLLIGGLIIAVLLIIIVPTAISIQQSNSSSSSNNN